MSSKESDVEMLPVEENVERTEPVLPPFWDGTPGTLTKNMVCRDGKLSVQVLDIVPCRNGTVIVGVARAGGEEFFWNVTDPKAHPLSRYDALTPEQRDFIASLWEYDKQ